MISSVLPLIGPAVTVQKALALLANRSKTAARGFAVLLWGDPGVAKSDLLDRLALDLTGTKHSIEQVNGQSLSVDLVRQWRDRACYGNLFSEWTVRRIDEFDCASPAARNEVLTFLDYLPAKQAVLATTNDFRALHGRLGSRFKCFEVGGPRPTEAAAFLVKHFKGLPEANAAEIVAKAVPEGRLAIVHGVNMRQCIESAECWLALREAKAA